jgi:tripartite-type tricarboxylate transporter receptor subunit TctC
MIRREPLIALAALLLLQFAPFARAQTNAASYPTKPIRFIVPYPPGGTTDIVARGIALKLSERTGQQVVIDNRAGASTILGAEAAAKSAPDGYTLLLATSTTMSINPQVFPKLPYDAVRDFAPISSAVYVPFVIATHPSVPANTITELIALAKANPGTIKYSTPGTASSNHVAGALLETMAGIKLHPLWPDIPCTGEAGLVGYEAGTWFGVVTRAGTPKPIVDKLNKEIVAALATPELKERLTAIGFDVSAGTAEEFARFMQQDRARAAKAIKAAGIKATD